MKHAAEMESCTKIYFLFIFNLVYIRIRKQFDDVTVKTIYKGGHERFLNSPCPEGKISFTFS